MKMRFRQAAVTVVVLVCLVGMTIQGTFGLEDGDNTAAIPAIDANSVSAEGPAITPPADQGSVPAGDDVQTGNPNISGENLPDGGAGTETGETGTETGSPDVMNPGGTNPDGTNPDGATPDGTNPDGTNPDGTNPDGATPDGTNPDGTNPDGAAPDGTNPDGTTPDGTDPDETAPDGTNPDGTDADAPGGEDKPPADDPSTDTPVPENPAPSPSVPDATYSPDSQPGEETFTDQDRVIHDSSADAVYTGNLYKPSGLFTDDREKIKYNVAIPIDGIPSFVTQEMIIGALKCQDEAGYPASVTIAQIIQESGFGKYGPDGEKGQGLSYLAYQYNNLFGIKGTGPAGSVDMRTGEQTSFGESYMTTAGFRVYNTYTECIEDRTKLLKEVYSDLIKDATDANTFAMRIGGRWATDIQYAQSLIRQMETYDLYRLDNLTVERFSGMIGIFANPCPGSAVSSPFGWREFTGSFHKGIDLGTGTQNIPTYAAQAGTVVTAGFSDSAGNWIVIDHGNGIVTKYMHHDKIYVSEGQHVEKGQQIGLSGTTGHSFGNHLHFQVEENGAAVDPAPYLGIEN